jgi:hypothetical protein
MFHAQNGLFFQRDGETVRVVKTSDAKAPNGSNVVMDESLTIESFASVTSSMSKSGERDGRFYTALEFLQQ